MEFNKEVYSSGLLLSGAHGHRLFGVNRLATALTGPDPANRVCRQAAPKVNWTELLTVRFNALLGGVGYAFESGPQSSVDSDTYRSRNWAAMLSELAMK